MTPSWVGARISRSWDHRTGVSAINFIPRRRSVWLKISIFIGILSATTYLALTQSRLLDNFSCMFVLCIAALLLAILAQISENSML